MYSAFRASSRLACASAAIRLSCRSTSRESRSSAFSFSRSHAACAAPLATRLRILTTILGIRATGSGTRTEHAGKLVKEIEPSPLPRIAPDGRPASASPASLAEPDRSLQILDLVLEAAAQIGARFFNDPLNHLQARSRRACPRVRAARCRGRSCRHEPAGSPKAPSSGLVDEAVNLLPAEVLRSATRAAERGLEFLAPRARSCTSGLQ